MRKEEKLPRFIKTITVEKMNGLTDAQLNWFEQNPEFNTAKELYKITYDNVADDDSGFSYCAVVITDLVKYDFFTEISDLIVFDSEVVEPNDKINEIITLAFFND